MMGVALVMKGIIKKLSRKAKVSSHFSIEGFLTVVNL